MQASRKTVDSTSLLINNADFVHQESQDSLTGCFFPKFPVNLTDRLKNLSNARRMKRNNSSEIDSENHSNGTSVIKASNQNQKQLSKRASVAMSEEQNENQNKSSYGDKTKEVNIAKTDGQLVNSDTTLPKITAIDTLSTIEEDDNWDEVYGGDVGMLKTFDDRAAKVRDGVYIGAFLAEQNRDELKRRSISHILQVGDNLSQTFNNEFKYKTIVISDTEHSNLLIHFRECFEFIKEAHSANSGVLVHCFAGISRSATICIGYLMWSDNLSMGAAYSMVERARPCTQPNPGFLVQLKTFESLGGDLDLLDQYNTYMAALRNQSRDLTRELSSDEFDFL